MKRSIIMLALFVGCTDDQQVESTYGVSNHSVELGPITCGTKTTSSIRVDNLGAEELVLAIDSSTPEIEVQQELVIPAFESRPLPISATMYRPSSSGTLTLVGFDKTDQIRVQMLGVGIPVTFDPPVVDFGSVLPNTTKELPLTATLGAGGGFALELALGPASTPRFEIIGAATARLDPTTPTATFTLHYLSSETPFEHDGRLPITITGAGTCTPPEVELKGTTVP